MNTGYTIKPDKMASFKKKLLFWSQQFSDVMWLDSNGYYENKDAKYHDHECLVAIGAQNALKASDTPFEELSTFLNTHKKWCFGYFAYDLKNNIENLSSENSDNIEFNDIHFFIPQYLFSIGKSEVHIIYNNKEINILLDEIEATALPEEIQYEGDIQTQYSKNEYIEVINKIKKHISIGDIYEMNFCQEFFMTDIKISPQQCYISLTDYSPTPFSCFVKSEDKYLISSSPERFLKKKENKIISQPIKGTAPRHHDNVKDISYKEKLKIDPKERAENIMITDLVRNDLAKSAKKGSVKVEELCEIYSFKRVHQMISTVCCELDKNSTPIAAIKNAFPMGSMTGAPKVRAMKLIEKYEKTKRGLFSGSVGYFTPNMDFDFNVVIRSILYNSTKKYVSFSVGSAITDKSIAENEYQECLVKAEPMMNLFKNTTGA